MNKIKIESIFGNKFIIQKIDNKRDGEFGDLCEVIFNSKGFVLKRDEILKLKSFFEEIKI